MRALFATTRGAGHFAHLFPLADAWVRHGHETLFAGPPVVADPVAAAGHDLWAVDDPPADELEAVWSRVSTLSQAEQNVVVIAEIFATLNVTAALPRLRDVVGEWRPDVIVREPNEYASALVAEEAGIPHARVAVGLAASEQLTLSLAVAPVDDARRAAGLALDPDAEALGGSPYLTAFPASFEDPGAPDQPDTLRYRNPAWDSQPNPLPAWWDDDNLPLVYVTFGSVAGSFAQSAPIFDLALEVAARLPARVLMTTGRGPDLEALVARAPTNVHVERWVPHADVVAHATVVVCHAGSGSTLGTLAAGVPIVAVPLFADQPFNAARVAATGAGLSVPPDPAAIRAAVELVLSEPRFGEAARDLAAEMRGHASIDEAVERLASL